MIFVVGHLKQNIFSFTYLTTAYSKLFVFCTILETAIKLNLMKLQIAWEQLNKSVSLAPIHNRKQYAKMVQLADLLTDVIGHTKKHPLIDLLEIIAELIRVYDAEHFAVPNASPRAVLTLLMKEHGLSQADLPEVGNQSVISMLLSGARNLNIRQIRALSKRFAAPATVFF
jgi:HTH-type transcriptional regulator/antitoxin HigA